MGCVSFLRAPLRPVHGHYAGERSQVAKQTLGSGSVLSAFWRVRDLAECWQFGRYLILCRLSELSCGMGRTLRVAVLVRAQGESLAADAIQTALSSVHHPRAKAVCDQNESSHAETAETAEVSSVRRRIRTSAEHVISISATSAAPRDILCSLLITNCSPERNLHAARIRTMTRLTVGDWSEVGRRNPAFCGCFVSRSNLQQRRL